MDTPIALACRFAAGDDLRARPQLLQGVSVLLFENPVMKLLRAFFATLFAVALLNGLALAADPTGTWKWSFSGPNGRTIDSTLKLELKEGKLTGTISGFRGDSPISEGTYQEDTVTFAVVRERDGQKRVSKYQGKVEGDTIKGTVEMPSREGGEPRKMDWTAQRAK